MHITKDWQTLFIVTSLKITRYLSVAYTGVSSTYGVMQTKDARIVNIYKLIMK